MFLKRVLSSRVSMEPRALFVVRRLRKDEDGVAAVEFGLIAFPFFLILAAIFEIGLFLFATYSLDNAVSDSARLVRTGQAQAGGLDLAKFKQEICKRSFLISDCTSRIRVDIQAKDTPAELLAVATANADGDLAEDDDLKFCMGSGRQLSQVTVFFEWSDFTKVGNLFRSSARNKTIIQTTIIQRNEPFNVNGSAGCT